MSQIQIFEHTLILSDNLLRGLILLLPLIGTGTLMLYHKPKHFEAVGILLGILLNIPYLLLLNILAGYMGWWNFSYTPASTYNIPIELILGWAFFWGGFLPYLFRSLSIVAPLLTAIWLDVLLMPQFVGLFTLGKHWLIGEAILVSACLIPSLVIFKITANRQYVLLRALIQSYIWGGWLFFLIPSALLYFDNKNIFSIFVWPIEHTFAFLTGLVFSMAIGYAGLFELAEKGLGTPVPFDQPKNLVTTGIYGYVANPLQISTLLIFICFSIAYNSALMLGAVITTVFFSEVISRWHQEIDTESRFGKDWIQYKNNVINWWPRLQKYIHKPH